MELIEKSKVVAEIERIKKEECPIDTYEGRCKLLWFEQFLSFLDTLKVKDPYEQCVQYDSIKAGIQAHAETYSFNIKSQLFPQLTKEQQVLWRKEIEQAVISGGDAGVTLARDQRYKENLEVKDVNLEKEIDVWYQKPPKEFENIEECAKHFFELGFKAKGE